MKKLICFVFLISILSISSLTLAQDVRIFLPKEVTGYTGETKIIEITIKNYQAKDDSFSVSVWPPQWAKVRATLDLPLSGIISINANSNATIKLYFSVDIDAEEIVPTFQVNVKSTTNENITDSQTILFKVVKRIRVSLSDIRLNKYIFNPEENLITENDVINTGITTEELAVQTLIKKDDKIIKKFDETISIPGKTTQKITYSYIFEKYATPGVYSIEVYLKDSLGRTISSKTARLSVKEIHNITHEKDVSYGLFFQTTRIKVRNEGNIIATSVFVTESIPSFMKSFFYPAGEPTVEVVDDKILYRWLIPELSPGEERVIEYELRFWNVWIASLIIVACVIFAFRYVYAPSIVKRHKHKGAITREKEIPILLEVRNRTRHEIKDVEIKDFVPTIARVIEKFDTLTPKIKVSDAGTELRWKLESMKPREERILTYRIKPIVDILGTLRLPRAQMKFITKKKEKKLAVSKSVFIRPG